MYNRVLITGSNDVYYDSLLTLIASVHKNSSNLVDKLLVYDFGLTNEQVFNLNKLDRVEVKSLESYILSNKEFCESFSSFKIKCYFFKILSLIESAKIAKKILWLDAGAMCLKPLDIIFEKIDSDGIFLVKDVHLNKNFTHNRCREIINASENELNDNQMWAGILGIDTNSKYYQMIEEIWSYAQIPGCIDGNEQNHRHDQSILSILASRYKCPTNDIDIFGYWTDSSRTYQTALETGSVIFVHRRGHNDHQGLVYKNGNN